MATAKTTAKKTPKKMKKTVNKKVRFGYYLGYITVDTAILKQAAKNKSKLDNAKKMKAEKKRLTKTLQEALDDEANIKNNYERYHKFGRNKWAAKSMFETLLRNLQNDKKYKTSFVIDGMPIEIEPGSFAICGNIVTFQLTKLRSDMLPAKKKINQEKEDIALADDEYIGEFTSILYDMASNAFMIQSNMYGLTHSQVEQYLTLLRRKLMVGKTSNLEYTMCELDPIVDADDVFEKMRKSHEIKKIRLRAADGIIGGHEGNPFANLTDAVGNRRGYVFDITISVNRDSEVEKIDKDAANDLLNFLDEISGEGDRDKNLLMEVTRKESENSATEIVNLLKPCLRDDITFAIEERASIGHEFMADQMKTVFEAKKGTIYRNIGHKEKK